MQFYFPGVSERGGGRCRVFQRRAKPGGYPVFKRADTSCYDESPGGAGGMSGKFEGECAAVPGNEGCREKNLQGNSAAWSGKRQGSLARRDRKDYPKV